LQVGAGREVLWLCWGRAACGALKRKTSDGLDKVELSVYDAHTNMVLLVL
jgi:hypothetical protein